MLLIQNIFYIITNYIFICYIIILYYSSGTNDWLELIIKEDIFWKSYSFSAQQTYQSIRVPTKLQTLNEGNQDSFGLPILENICFNKGSSSKLYCALI